LADDTRAALRAFFEVDAAISRWRRSPPCKARYCPRLCGVCGIDSGTRPPWER